MELLKNIQDLEKKINNIWELLKLNQLEKEIVKQKQEISSPDFWNNQNRAIDVSKKLEDNEKDFRFWDYLKKELVDLKDFLELASEELTELDIKEYEKKFELLQEKFNKQEFYVLFANKYDKENAILSIHAGTGGVDAQDWAQILERMFLRFCEKKNFQAHILEKTYGAEAGIKSMTIEIKGKWAYGYLKSEAGVHRLVRISPFDAEGMRHTSFALVDVIPELEEANEVEILDKDLKIDVYKSSGPGGQGVNTTDSAVRITHLPTKIQVACQNERSQHQNKETALKIIKVKLYKLQQEEREREEAKLRGEVQRAEWGNQIRSYVMQPYKMVKDHRTACETQDINKVLDGDLDDFVQAFLKFSCI